MLEFNTFLSDGHHNLSVAFTLLRQSLTRTMLDFWDQIKCCQFQGTDLGHVRQTGLKTTVVQVQSTPVCCIFFV